MTDVILVQGYNFLRYVNSSPGSISTAFPYSGGKLPDFIGIRGEPSRDIIRSTLNCRLKSDQEPALVFALAQARHGYGRCGQMFGFYGSSDGEEPKIFLQDVIEASKGRSNPVDVFMMLARRPDFIRDMAQDLPKGSVVVAVHVSSADITPVFYAPRGRGFHFRRGLREYRAALQEELSARRLLEIYLAQKPDKVLRNPLTTTNDLNSTLPAIAISGEKLPTLDVLEKRLASRRTDDELTAKFLERNFHIMNVAGPHDFLLALSRYSPYRQHVGRSGKDITAASYSLALTAGWPRPQSGLG